MLGFGCITQPAILGGCVGHGGRKDREGPGCHKKRVRRTDIALVGASQCLHEVGDLAEHSQVMQHVMNLGIKVEGVIHWLFCNITQSIHWLFCNITQSTIQTAKFNTPCSYFTQVEGEKIRGISRAIFSFFLAPKKKKEEEKRKT